MRCDERSEATVSDLSAAGPPTKLEKLLGNCFPHKKKQKTTCFPSSELTFVGNQRHKGTYKKPHGIHGTNVYLLYIDEYHKNQPNVGKSIPVPWMVWELRCTRSSNELIISCNSWTERSPDASLLLGVHVLRCKQGEILADAAQGMMACMPPSESFTVMSFPCKFP